MTPRQLLLILRARYKVALLFLLLTAGSALVVIQFLPRQYTATTALVVDVRAPDPITAMLRQASMATQEDIIKSDRVAQRVTKILNLQENKVARQQWLQATQGKGRFDAWFRIFVTRWAT